MRLPVRRPPGNENPRVYCHPRLCTQNGLAPCDQRSPSARFIEANVQQEDSTARCADRAARCIGLLNAPTARPERTAAGVRNLLEISQHISALRQPAVASVRRVGSRRLVGPARWTFGKRTMELTAELKHGAQPCDRLRATAPSPRAARDFARLAHAPAAATPKRPVRTSPWEFLLRMRTARDGARRHRKFPTGV